MAQGSSPKRDVPPSAPTSGAVVSYQESRSAGIVYHEEKGGLLSAVASPVATAKLAPAPAAPKADPKAAPKAAPAVAARKAPAVPSKVAQGPASPDRARP